MLLSNHGRGDKDVWIVQIADLLRYRESKRCDASKAGEPVKPGVVPPDELVHHWIYLERYGDLEVIIVRQMSGLAILLVIGNLLPVIEAETDS